MKSNSFREQVNIITSWFKDWSECEQTVALYSLLKKSSPVQAKFLDQILQHSLADCVDVKHLEARANDEAYVRSLYSGERELVIHQLLKLLPLLQVGKISVKKAYLQLIQELLSHTIHNGVNVEESRQLLSYSLIHPAINSEERSKFQNWLGCLDERFTYGNGGGSTATSNSSGNSLSVGHSQSHSPSPGSQHSLAHLSPELTLSQEYISTNQSVAQGHLSPSPLITSHHGHSSPSPIIASPAHSSWHQPHYSGLDASAAIHPLTTNGDTSGCAQYIPNGHMPLRSTNSHAGAFGASPGHMSIQATMSAPPNFNSIQSAGTNSHLHVNNTHAPLRRTPSITPPVKLQNPEKAVSEWIKTNHGHHPILASRSQYSDHAPLSPQSSVSSSGSGGSDSHHDDGPQPSRDSFLEEGSGMREVPVWLKTLRLHKYAYLFRQMAYEDMLNVTEDWLEKHNVTKGARHKIYISIEKLRERQEVLRKLEKNIVEDGGSIKCALGEMKAMLNTPIKAFSPNMNSPDYRTSPSSSLSNTSQSSTADEVLEGDLPGQFCRLMNKVCTHMLLAHHPDEECFQICLQLIDKCLNHEAFSSRQKKQLHALKQSAQKMWQPTQKFLERPRTKPFVAYPSSLGRHMLRGNSGRSPLTMTQSHQPNWGMGKRSILGSGCANSGHMQVVRNSSLNISAVNKLSLLEPTKTPISRTQSAPTHRPLALPVQSGENANDTEINAHMDSLCISMTEHALGSSDNNDRGSGF
ncbi:protein Smaug 1 [Biomphalaria glabrata]|nr:protein Smaug 1 [Biomphalaria glabrata]